MERKRERVLGKQRRIRKRLLHESAARIVEELELRQLGQVGLCLWRVARLHGGLARELLPESHAQDGKELIGARNDLAAANRLP